MQDCLFCKIIAGDIPSSKVYEDDFIYAFNDISPKADVHILVVPKAHIARLDEASKQHSELLAHMMLSLSNIAKLQGLDNGFRTIINTGSGGGQEVYHLHMHILGGKQLPGF